jgi:quercetin dioxygenase-like cupin family protein
MQVLVAAFTPGMYSVVHHHSGVEGIYVIEGQACYETPTRGLKGSKGETLMVGAGTPHRAVVMGSALRYVLAVIVHNASQPATTRMPEHPPTQLVGCR